MHFEGKHLYKNGDYVFLCIYFINKDYNIHKSEALKQYDKQTLKLVECQN